MAVNNFLCTGTHSIVIYNMQLNVLTFQRPCQCIGVSVHLETHTFRNHFLLNVHQLFEPKSILAVQIFK